MASKYDIKAFSNLGRKTCSDLLLTKFKMLLFPSQIIQEDFSHTENFPEVFGYEREIRLGTT